MPYAFIDSKTNRILEWSEEHLFGFDTFFENGEHVNANCVNGSEDFVIEDGKAVYKPLPENEIAKLKRKLEETDYITAKTVDALASCESISAIIAELATMRTKYGFIIEQRQQWREHINELEGGE